MSPPTTLPPAAWLRQRAASEMHVYNERQGQLVIIRAKLAETGYRRGITPPTEVTPEMKQLLREIDCHRIRMVAALGLASGSERYWKEWDMQLIEMAEEQERMARGGADGESKADGEESEGETEEQGEVQTAEDEGKGMKSNEEKEEGKERKFS